MSKWQKALLQSIYPFPHLLIDPFPHLLIDPFPHFPISPSTINHQPFTHSPMTLTQFAVTYRPFTWVLLTSILALGMFAVFTLSRREDPDLKGGFVQVTALYPGASASQVEQLVTQPIEQSLLQIDETKVVTS